MSIHCAAVHPPGEGIRTHERERGLPSEFLQEAGPDILVSPAATPSYPGVVMEVLPWAIPIVAILVIVTILIALSAHFNHD